MSNPFAPLSAAPESAWSAIHMVTTAMETAVTNPNKPCRLIDGANHEVCIGTLDDESRQTFIRLSRAQRDAYFAWQNAAPGEASRIALAAYTAASEAQREFERMHGVIERIAAKLNAEG